ncbi:MAG: hypothetical protein DYH20_08450 [Gammaproteobacteria bacterium PRO9]|nr:hypothetical protein [Gammaproteobacteria bacterium PRO9]
MLSYVFLAYAVIHLTIWLWGWKLWAAHGRPVALLLVLVSGTLLFYDNFRIGIGRFLGEGGLLYNLSVPAFAWHWSMLPLLVIAAGSIARLADIPGIFSMELHPACLADTLRYSTSVRADQVCPGGTTIPGGADAAFVAIITNVIVLVVGIVLWVQRRWPWMAVGAGLMFIAAGAFAGHRYGLVIANLGEIAITLGLIATCVHFARPVRWPGEVSG